MKNYYDILGVKIEDPQIKIKKAYFALVRKYPPDRFPDEFMEIREAYEALSNEETRREYDEVIALSPALREMFEHSRKAFAEGDYEIAIKGLEDVAKRVPESSLVQDLLGQAYMENGNSVKAIRVFEKLTLEYPHNAAFMGHLAESYLDRGWHRRARTAYQKATQLDEDNISFWLGWSETCKIAEDFEEQRDILQKAVAIAKEQNWDSIILYMNIVVNDIAREDIDEAKEHLDQLMDLAIDREDIRDIIGWSLMELSNALLEAGWIDMAIVIIDHAIQLLPDNKEVKEVKNMLDFVINTGDIVNNFMKDQDIHEDIRELVAVEIIPEYFDEDDVPKDIITIAMEANIATELQTYLPSISILKERYPQLYDIKKDFFESLKNPRKRRNLIRKAEKAYRRYKNMFELYGDDEYDDFPKPQQPYVRETPKVGRNDPCPCGSGKKYKKCCGR